MITLPTPVQVPTGTITVQNLTFTLTDNEQKKLVQVKFDQFPFPLTVWSGAAYDAAGDYTEAQLENAVLAILEPNPAAVLATLFRPPVKAPTPAAAPPA